LQCSIDELIRAAGKKVLRLAFELLANEQECSIDEQAALLVVTFPRAGKTVRLLSSEGMAGSVLVAQAMFVITVRRQLSLTGVRTALSQMLLKLLS
jgi:hypothetical protein